MTAPAAFIARWLMGWMELERLTRDGVDETIGFIASAYGARGCGTPADADGVARTFALSGRTAVYREIRDGQVTQRRVPLRAVVRHAESLLTDDDRARLCELVQLRTAGMTGRTIPDPTHPASATTPPPPIRAGAREQALAERDLAHLERSIHERPVGQLDLLVGAQ